MILKSMVLLESSISQHGWCWKISNFVLGWIRERIMRDVVQQVVARDRQMSYQHAWRVSVNLMFIELCWMIGPFRRELAKTNERWPSKLLLSIAVSAPGYCEYTLCFGETNQLEMITWLRKIGWPNTVSSKKRSGISTSMWDETERQNWRNWANLIFCFAAHVMFRDIANPVKSRTSVDLKYSSRGHSAVVVGLSAICWNLKSIS